MEDRFLNTLEALVRELLPTEYEARESVGSRSFMLTWRRPSGTRQVSVGRRPHPRQGNEFYLEVKNVITRAIEGKIVLHDGIVTKTMRGESAKVEDDSETRRFVQELLR
jgi:hypothetical protein